MIRTNLTLLSYAEKLYINCSNLNAQLFLKSFAAKQQIFSQGVVTNKVLIIKEGLTKCYFTEENNKDYILEFLGKGEVLGEVESIAAIPSLCTIETLTKVEAYVFDKLYFTHLIEKDSTLQQLLLQSFAQRIINTSCKSSKQQLFSINSNLAKLLHALEKQGIAISKEDMASYLGISVRSLNRSLQLLKQ